MFLKNTAASPALKAASRHKENALVKACQADNVADERK
ncbi:hypothetical protein KIS1582_0770 [Cytobacillus firmus]|uniref:Uncharacterized protein n=1 Tax=Cytobacillus firmus TaxID=1399 RepID=A0A800NEV8_CYTFI|nr:hypothetical protein KIS1582_0770 [Cytobacillus firmus]